MAQFTHPNVLSLLAVVVDQEPNLLLTELMENGSLLGYLLAHPTLPLPTLVLAGEHVADGMAYLSEKGFVHR